MEELNRIKAIRITDDFSRSLDNSPRTRSPRSPSLQRNPSANLELSIPLRKLASLKGHSGLLHINTQVSSTTAALPSPLPRSLSYVPGKAVSITLGLSEDEKDYEEDTPAVDVEVTEKFPLDILSLPDRCLVNIISLSVSSLSEWLSMKLVCKKWHQLANTALRSLRISHVKPLTSPTFPKALSSFSSLTSLQISLPSGDTLTDDTIIAVASECPQLKSLYLSYWEVEVEENSTDDSTRSFVSDYGLDLLFRNCHLLEEFTFATHSNISSSSAEPFQLPDSIGSLGLLKSLAIHSQQVSSIPDSIGNLESLEELAISCPRIKCIPESSLRLLSLKSLDLSSCKGLEILPKGLAFIPELKSLVLRDCTSLTSLPLGEIDFPAFGEGSSSSPLKPKRTFSNLTQLNCQDCHSLRELPETFGSLFPYLTQLNLRNCSLLEDLPESLGLLQDLKELNLGGCPLDIVPTSLISLTRLNKRDKAHINNLLMQRTLSPPLLER